MHYTLLLIRNSSSCWQFPYMSLIIHFLCVAPKYLPVFDNHFHFSNVKVKILYSSFELIFAYDFDLCRIITTENFLFLFCIRKSDVKMKYLSQI